MTYSEVTLSISPDEAAKLISESVSGIRRTRDDDSYVYKTNSGVTLAILKPAHRHEGRSILRYRAAMISPQLAPARRKARRIRDVLSEHHL